jgi:HEAT repeat protein
LAAGGRLGEEAVPVLIDALNDAYFDVRASAATCLARIGEPALPALRNALAADDYYTQIWAAVAVGRIGKAAGDRETALCLLHNAQLPGCDQQRQMWAAWALMEIACGDPLLAEELIAAYRSSRSQSVRRCIGVSLTYLGDAVADIIPEMITHIGQHDHVRAVLREFGKAAVAPLMDAVSGDIEKRVAWAIYETLADIGEDAAAAVPLLVKELQNPRDPWFGQLAARLLGQMGIFTEEVVSSLEAASRSGDARISEAASVALEQRK